jgi:hypothetical protein
MASTGVFDRNGLEPATSTVGPNGENGLYLQTYNIIIVLFTLSYSGM